MTIVEVSKLFNASGFAPVYPFVYMIMPGGIDLADFWVNTFGAPDESRDYSITVRSFIRGITVKYNETISFNDCILSEGSFYWNGAEQKLFIHFEHNQEGWTDTYQYGSFFGFSDSGVVYVDDQEYIPLIESVPKVSQKQDIINYKKLSFSGGSIKLNNRESISAGVKEGQLDSFIDTDLFGNDVYTYYLDENEIVFPNSALRTSLIPVDYSYLKDYGISAKSIDLRVQDPRKAQNINIPRDFFDISDYPDIGDFSGDVIPLMYGEVREAKSIPTNSDTTSGVVNHRAALILTVLGTVQVDIDDLWTTVTPSSSDLPNGSFVLAQVDGRNANGSIRDCRLLNPTGIAITYTSDIIKDLDNRYLNLAFLDSNYNTTEWNSEQTALTGGGVVFDSPIRLFDAIQVIQNGSNIGFRFEINPNGVRTIRIDDPDRAVSGRIAPEKILNRDTMPVNTDSDLVYAEVKVKYDKSYNSGKYISVTNDDFTESVLQRYKEQETLTVETILNNQTDADERALNDATRFSNIPETMSLTLMGKEFLQIRIFDTYDIEATPDFADADTQTIIGREYYGFRKGKVIGINPDTKNALNKVQFLLL